MDKAPSAVVPFLFECEGLVRVVIHDGKPWFVATDVCRAIGIKQATKAVEALDDDEKWVTSTHPFFAEKALWLISEGGLYTLILRSRAATTPGTVQHRFRKWVTAEVLPAIRLYAPFGIILDPSAPPQGELPLDDDGNGSMH